MVDFSFSLSFKNYRGLIKLPTCDAQVSCRLLMATAGHAKIVLFFPAAHISFGNAVSYSVRRPSLTNDRILYLQIYLYGFQSSFFLTLQWWLVLQKKIASTTSLFWVWVIVPSLFSINKIWTGMKIIWWQLIYFWNESTNKFVVGV